VRVASTEPADMVTGGLGSVRLASNGRRLLTVARYENHRRPRADP
jgi:hypothetical protein